MSFAIHCAPGWQLARTHLSTPVQDGLLAVATTMTKSKNRSAAHWTKNVCKSILATHAGTKDKSYTQYNPCGMYALDIISQHIDGRRFCLPPRAPRPARGFHAICAAASLLTPCQRTLEGVFQRKGDGHRQLNEDRASLCCGRGKGCRRCDHH